MNGPRLPAPLAALTRRLPPYPGAWLFARWLDLGLAPRLPADVKQALEGRRMRLGVRDAGIQFDFGWQGGSVRALRAGAAPDLLIAATLHDLWLLGTRREDPDTLFFGRRLVLEGDTELALLFKNTLDALDGPALPS
jgi:predicted lipid carrier protein YhbT